MQGSVASIVGNRIELVGSFRIYVTAQGELVIPIGNCRVYVEDEQARECPSRLSTTPERRVHTAKSRIEV